jgi:photosystem II stability/assembly factor-like uncharacterized protein
MNPSFRIRLVGACTVLALVVLTALAKPPAGVDPTIGKEIDELEQRLQKLQDRLKAIRQAAAPPAAAPMEQPPPHLDRLFTWRPIGPANMGGRITSLAVFDADPTCYYVATASGGLLKTENNGSSFTHQFDRESTVSLGAVAVARTNRALVWAGTGEANPRNSVSFGDGVYRSTDGGKTWTNRGLKKSFQIGKIVIHPQNPDIVYVCALGRLYGPSEERGLYKTSDGGKNWQRIWFHDDKTGALDLVLSPTDPNVLLLAAWQRRRDEFDSFLGTAKPPPAADHYAPATTHGPGSGLYRSTDGGKTWQKLTQGLPGAALGRIGLDWSRKDPRLVFAIVDSEKAGTGLAPSDAYLGVLIQNSPEGVRISAVQKDSPAAKAKLAKGDLLVSLDGKDLKKADDLLVPLQPRQPGDKIKLGYRRGDKTDIALVTLGPRPGTDKKGQKRGSLGVQIEDAEGGVMLTEVLEKGAADKAGLKVGDLLLTLDDVKLISSEVLVKALKGKIIGDRVKLGYQRGREKKVAAVTLDRLPTTPGRPYEGALGGQAANIQDMQGPGGQDTGGIYRSTDAGQTWARVNSLDERPFYFSVVRCDPGDASTVYALGVSLYRSTDGGRTFSREGLTKGVHSDLHDLWIDPHDSRHLLLGTDGGVYVSYDRAASWEMLDHLALGQFYHVAVDARRPYRVYGGLQDNGSWAGPSQTLRPSGPANADYQVVQGGDGFVCRVDENDPDLVYSESQNGNMLRRNLRTGQIKPVRPRMKPGAGKFRFNWNTPFILSGHNPRIFYAAGNYVFRSLDRGEDLRIFSPEITRTPRGSATALAESPRDADVLWVGTDDGAVWLTRDGGKSWTNLSERFSSAGLPGPRWVASLEPSRVVSGRCYVVFDAHRSDDDAPYVFVTEDFGQTWKSLRANLPAGLTRVLREDRRNPDLLYLGTEFAVYASVNRGASWFKINGPALPTVAVHEIAQPATADEIVAATHGRSLWVLDVTTLRQLRPEHWKGKADLFAPATVTRWQLDFTHEAMFRTGTRHFVGQNPPRQATLDFVLAKQPDKLSLKVLDVYGNVVKDLDLSKEKEAGVHRIGWDLALGPAPKGKKGKFGPKGKGGPGRFAKPGTYRLVLDADGVQFVRALTVEADPRTQTAGSTVDEAEELRRLLRRQP